MTTHLQREIAKLKKRLIELSAEVEHQIDQACEALEDLDLAKANRVIGGDNTIDDEEVDIEEECLKIMALYQPVASDLRMVVSVMKMNNDLERMGDLAANIAEYVVEITRLPPIAIPDTFRQLFDASLSQVRRALDALVNSDSSIARDVCRQDDVVDDLNRRIILDIRERLRDDPEHIPSLLFLMSISRSVERIADYATNIAEDVHYMSQGTIIRHRVKERAQDGPPEATS